MLLTSGTLDELAHGAGDVPHPPASARDDHHAALLGQPERAARRRAGSGAARNSADISGRTSRTLPGPAMRSTEGIDSPYITRCMSMPGWAQKNRPVRSVIVATVGQLTSPVRRRRASTTVTAG